MSADNWGICPKCKQIKESERQKKMEKANKQYGKITPDEYIKLAHEAEEPFDKEKLRTMREDYNISVDEDGTFGVDYSCSCTNCKFTFKYNHTQELDSLLTLRMFFSK